MKYARIERERRFLLHELPPGLGQAPQREIRDLYIEGTSLRLRHVLADPPQWKLTQKQPYGEESAYTLITNIYLSEGEYVLLASLPGRGLRKVRFTCAWGTAQVVVDVFRGALAGLVLAEVEFETDEAMQGFAVPPFFGREVTHQLAFTGGQLAASRFEDVSMWLEGAYMETYEGMMSGVL